MILDDENILIDNIENDYIDHIDHLYKNMDDYPDYNSYLKDALKILNNHKLIPDGKWVCEFGIFKFLANDYFPLVRLTYYFHKKPTIHFANIIETLADFEQIHHITIDEYKKLIDKFKQQYEDKVIFYGGIDLRCLQ